MKVPSFQKACSQAVAHTAKSAIRGFSGRLMVGRRFKPTASASRRTPRMRGRLASNAANSSLSDRRFCVGDQLQGHEQGAIGEVRAGDDVADAVQDDRTGGVEQHLVVVGPERAHRETAAARQPAQRVGQPRRQSRHIVEDQQMGVGGGDEELAIVPRQGAQRRGVGVDERPQDLRDGRLARCPARRQRRAPDKGRDR